jgi:hypothetical protein
MAPAARPRVPVAADLMTTEQFRQDYHLLDRVAAGAVETYHAQAAAGALVMVHFLRGAPADVAAITAALADLNPEHGQRVLKTLDVDGVPTLITRFILDFTTLHEWLGLAEPPHAADEPPTFAPAPPAAPAEPAEPAEPQPAPTHAYDAAPTPGEFTAMFAAPVMNVQPPGDAEPPQPSVQAPAAAAAPVQPAEPAPSQSAEPAPVQSAEPAPDGPGEFTMLFRAATPATPATPAEIHAATPAPAPAPPPQAAAFPPPSQPAPPSAPAAATAPPPTPPPTPQPAPPEQAAPPGEYTLMFGAPPRAADDPAPGPDELPVADAPAAPPPVPPPVVPPPLIAPPAPPAPPAANAPPAAWTAAPPPQPPTAAAPGEYTRMFGAAQPPADATWPAGSGATDRQGAAGQSPASGAASPDTGDYFARLSGGVPPRPEPVAMQPAPGALRPQAGPSEFTRVVSAVPPPSAPPPIAPPPLRAAAPAPPREPVHTSDRGLIIGLGAVLLAALVFILLFVLLG